MTTKGKRGGVMLVRLVNIVIIDTSSHWIFRGSRGKKCLMSPTIDFACNIYKILKEKEESGMDVNSAAGFSCPWKQLP